MKNQFLTLALATLVITGTAITSSASVNLDKGSCKSQGNLEIGLHAITIPQDTRSSSNLQQVASAKGQTYGNKGRGAQ